MNFKKTILALLPLTFALALSAGPKEAALEKMREELAGKSIRTSWLPKQDVPDALKLLNPDGSFSDLAAFEKEVRTKNLTQKEFNYEKPQAQIVAMTTKAFQRLWGLIEAMRDGRIPKERAAELKTSILRSIIRYGDLEVNRISTHAGRWHSSCFFLPTAAVNLYFFYFDDMRRVESGKEKSPDIAGANKILKELVFQAWKQPLRKDETDQNIVSPERFRNSTFYVGGNATSYRPLKESALVMNSTEMMDVVAEVALRSLEMTSQTTAGVSFWDEGFTADGAGWGHGRQSLVWGYPMDGLSGSLGILNSLKDSPWAKRLPKETVQACLNYIRGSSWYYYKGFVSPLVSRDNMMESNTKPGKIRTAYIAGLLLNSWAESFTPEELRELRMFSHQANERRIGMNGFAPGVYSGIRVFFNQDDLICKNDDYSMLLNMASYRCSGLESGSYGYNMFANDGVTVFLRDGGEWFRSFGAYDPLYFPGSTVRAIPNLTPGNDWSGYCSKRNFAVGVTDSKEDFAAGFILEKFNVTWKDSPWKAKTRFGSNPTLTGVVAYKSYFKFGPDFLMLGCGITDTEPENGGNFVTTIEQVEQKKDFAQLDKKGLWFRNNGFAYGVFPEFTIGDLRTSNVVRPLKWEKMHRSNRKVEGSVPMFQFLIDHGKNPKNAAYAYLVSSTGAIPAQMPRLLSNSPELQAAESPDAKTVGAIFYSKTAGLKTAWGEWSVSAPCGVLIQKNGNSFAVTVADAEMNPKLNDITVSLKRKGQTVLNTVIPLPREPFRGMQSVAKVKFPQP